MNTVENYLNKFTQWANDRNLVEGGNPTSQFLKLMEEHGEHVAALHRFLRSENKEDALLEVMDGIGDTAVVLTVIAAQCGINVQSGREGWLEEPTSAVNLTHALCLVAVGIQALSKGSSQGMVAGAVTDAFRWLNISAKNVGVTFTECLEAAWSEIKDRKGRMVDGLFVKEE